jgi:hypothetical protein
MSKVNVQLCPETGICSIVKADGSKIDLMPDEVAALRSAAGNKDAIRTALAQVDSDFAAGLAATEIEQVSSRLK